MKKIILFFCLLFISEFLFAQSILNIQSTNESSQNSTDLSKILSVSLTQSHSKITPGENLYLILKVVLNPEWHINSNKPNEDYLIPTDVTLNSENGFLISQKIFPKAKEIKFDFSDVPVSVYEGEIEIPVIIKVPENLVEGEYSFELVLNYQACNNQTCLPPKEEKFL